MRIDAHQHFWKFDPVRDTWITPDMQVIRKDFLPGDLAPLMESKHIDACVAVQADQSENETTFLLDLANKNKFIKGVVGWVDLRSQNIDERLSYYRSFPLVKGFRHVVQGEPNGFLLQPDFIRGVKSLARFGFTYDLLVFPHQLSESLAFVRQLSDQPIIIDHLAKPYIKRKEIEPWRAEMRALAQFEHVWCKVSGMITEANWSTWTHEDFAPYMDAVLESFGPDRLVFGSDWPVCLVAGSYPQVVELTEHYLETTVSKEEKKKIMGENAIRFYNL